MNKGLWILAVMVCLISSFFNAEVQAECTRLKLYAGWENPATGTGPSFTHTWGLKNNTNCSLNGFTIGNPDVYKWTGTSFVKYSASISGSYTKFSLAANGGTGQVTAQFNFTLPDDANYRIFFDIITNSGSVYPYLCSSYPGKCRLWTDVGTMIAPCIGKKPTVDYTDHVNMGDGSVIAKAKVSNAKGEPTIELNGEDEQPMEESDDDGFVAKTDPEDVENEHKITVKGECNLVAYLDYMFKASRSGNFGNNSCIKDSATCLPGTQKCSADPINTAIGNFFWQETDGTVAGLGNTTIKMERTYNSQAVLWTPASMRRYFPDGDDEVVVEPPLYFGKGWTSVFGEFLLKIDMAPVFKGVQILFADGHTANFKESGDGTLVSDSPGNHDVVTKDGDEYVLHNNGCKCSLDTKRFNKDGKLVSISDRNGNKITLNYDGKKLKSVENASGRKIEFESNDKGQITKATLPEGVVLKYEYNDDGLLTAFVNGRGNRTEYKYDSNKQMTEVKTPKGHPAVRVRYNSDTYRVTEQIVGETEKYTFDFDDKTTTVTNAYGNKNVHHYDDKMRLFQIDHPNGYSEYFAYDDDFNRIYYKDQAGAKWNWTYDKNGNRLTADGPMGWQREWSYNEMNLVTKLREKVNSNTFRETSFEYDSRGNLIKICNALGNCGTVNYDNRGLITDLYDLAGNRTAHAYDTEGDLISVTDAEGATTGFDHDGLGRVIEMKKPMSSTYRYVYDPNSNLVTVNGPLGFKIEFQFDNNDNLSTKIDPNGGKIAYDYNASDKVREIKNQLGFSTATYAYGLMNERSGFTDAEGRSWSYLYDKLLRVNHIQGPLDTHFYYAYNPVGKIIDFTDANGRITHTDYDELYRALTMIRNYRPAEAPNADTNVTYRYEYDLLGNILKMIDPEGFATAYQYDLQSQRTRKSDAEGHEWQFAYDPMGNLKQVINSLGFKTAFDYTPTYRLQKMMNPEEHAAAYKYNPDGNLTDITDPRGVTTHFDYDELSRRIREVDNNLPGNPKNADTNVTTEYSFDLAGNLIAVKNPRFYKAQFNYDAAHRKTEIIDFEKGSTKFAYDRVNNMLTVTDANGNSTVYAYDALNRLVRQTNAENEASAFRYDPMGNRTHFTEADGTVTLYGYDAVYRLNRVTENYRENAAPNNDTNVLTQYTYNPRGLLTKIVNANNAPTAFDYNSVGRMIKETDPLNNIWAYAYDGEGNRLTRTDANGALTNYAYYPDNQLAQIDYADKTSVRYAYDPNNNRIAMQDSLGNTAWSYDPLNRVTQVKDSLNRSLKYAYDAAGNRIRMTYPDNNQVQYAYSGNNWLKTATNPGKPKDDKTLEKYVISYNRDKVGNILKITNPNFTVTEMAYDKVYRTLTLANKQIVGAQETNSAFAYTYNEVGHVTQTIETYGWRNPPVVTETYNYDGLHRLIGVVADSIKNNGEKEIASYEYDAVGNRMKWTSLTGLSTQTLTDGYTNTYAYNAANQLLNVNVDSVKKNPNINLLETYTYDRNGSRINRLRVDENDKNALIEGVDYKFDPENRMVEALDYQLGGKDSKTRTDRAITTLKYDGGGRRLVNTYDPKSNAAQGVKKQVQYVFDGLDPVSEYDMLVGNDKRDNFYRGAGGRITTMHDFKSGTQGQMSWYHYNFKGDVVGLTKQNGNSTHNYRYDAYGSVIPENGSFTDPHNHYTLTGKEFDENTGLIYFGARHYDARVGGWTTQDLYRGKRQQPKSLHRYGYVLDNPINYYDNFGFWPTDIHNRIIDEAFPNLPDEIRNEIKKGSKEADSIILPPYQMPGYDYVHSMRASNQDPHIAADLMKQFIQDKLQQASKEFSNGDCDDGFFYLGMALHPLMDSTSPSHKGFQVMDWTNFKAHSDAEKTITNEQINETIVKMGIVEPYYHENVIPDYVTHDSQYHFMDYNSVEVGDIVKVDLGNDGTIDYELEVKRISKSEHGYDKIRVYYGREDGIIGLGEVNDKHSKNDTFYVSRPGAYFNFDKTIVSCGFYKVRACKND
jgi:RHS repeat-associated protein